MKFYLSSFKIGSQSKELVRMMEPSKMIGYVPNARDYSNSYVYLNNQIIASDIAELTNLGLDVQIIDLKNYFGRIDELRGKINGLGALFFAGGNTFILRQAMKASGFDIIFKELLGRVDFVYSGYSAGIAVLYSDLKAVQLVDNPTFHPYKEISETIWMGLGYLDYLILPHYKSNHPESETIDRLFEYCQLNKIPCKTLRDGEVIIIE
jgi:dipeptidase E